MASLFGAVKSMVRGKRIEDFLNSGDGRLIDWTDEEILKMKRYNLQVELAKRNLEVKGNKKTLRQRLMNAVREEKEQKLAYEAMIESKRKAEADLEASGSIYVVGRGGEGQLGLDEQGGKTNRRRFRCIMSLRGKGIKNVVASNNMVMCLCDSGDAYAFGGGGTGHLCREIDRTKRISERRMDTTYRYPTVVEALKGEGVIQISLSPGHGAAISDGGDVFTWGSGRYGQLGLGEPLVSQDQQQLVDLPVGEYAQNVVVGSCHTAVLCESGKVYTWGLASNAQLGVGTRERYGVAEEQKSYFPVPTLVKNIERFKVKQIASGANHVLALTHMHGVWSWGSGDGGRLGHGDLKDRLEPCRIKTFENEIVIQVEASTWHSVAVVALTPFARGGLLYTWGSGYHGMHLLLTRISEDTHTHVHTHTLILTGQLALGTTQTVSTPQPVTCLRDMHIFVDRVVTGSHHSALFDIDGDLYTWGNNEFCELGRGFKGKFTPVPGKVPCFGVFVGRIPRGKVCDVACGHGFTVVCTHAYNGPSEGEIDRMQEEETELLEQREKEALRLKEEAFARDHRLKSTLAPKMRIGRIRRSSSSSSYLQVVWSHRKGSRRSKSSRSCQEREEGQEEDTRRCPRR